MVTHTPWEHCDECPKDPKPHGVRVRCLPNLYRCLTDSGSVPHRSGEGGTRTHPAFLAKDRCALHHPLGCGVGSRTQTCRLMRPLRHRYRLPRVDGRTITSSLSRCRGISEITGVIALAWSMHRATSSQIVGSSTAAALPQWATSHSSMMRVSVRSDTLESYQRVGPLGVEPSSPD